MTAADRIRLAHGGPGASWQCLDLALAAAREAGVKALPDNRQLSSSDQLAVALQAADEAIEKLAVELSEEHEAAAE
jgi:hypothetical protein